jgi:chorismate synthase
VSNTFGTLFRLTTFGESHGVGIGGIVDGCPPRVSLDLAAVQRQVDRRRPGQSSLTTARQEADRVRFLSGMADGVTLGTPIGFLIENTDMRPADYCETLDAPRPSHADYTYRVKYGATARSGGGRASARETAARVVGGAIAEAFLRPRYGIEIVAWTSRVGSVEAPDLVSTAFGRGDVDASPVRCPDAGAAGGMIREIEAAKAEGDSVGGVVTCVCRGVPAGWGEPVFDKANALIAHAMLSLPACKGVEIGSGFAAAALRGSAHNDAFVKRAGGSLGTRTNRGGGMQGGITNGEPVWFRVAFKPAATIARPQASVDYEGRDITVAGKGRHDPCVLPRAVPIVEAMAALVLADLALLSEAHAVRVL